MEYNIDYGVIHRLNTGGGSILDSKVITRFSFQTNIRNNRRNRKKIKYMMRKIKGLNADCYTTENNDRRIRFTILFLDNTKLGFKGVQNKINDVFSLIGRLWHGKYDKRFLRWRGGGR